MKKNEIFDWKLTYSHGISSNLLDPGIKSEMKQLNKTTKIINDVQSGSVEIRAEVRRNGLFGRNNHNDFGTENRKKSLFRLTIMNVWK